MTPRVQVQYHFAGVDKLQRYIWNVKYSEEAKYICVCITYKTSTASNPNPKKKIHM